MDWSHVGVFAGNSLAYDADNSGCPGDPNGSGVALRPISRYYQNGYDIKYSQLASLVWRIYYDNEDHPVNVDSNHRTYRKWLDSKYGWWLGWYIITFTIAPDDIALDSDLDSYYERYNIQGLN